MGKPSGFMYLAHHELDSIFIVTVIIIVLLLSSSSSLLLLCYYLVTMIKLSKIGEKTCQTYCGVTSEELTKADALIGRACVSLGLLHKCSLQSSYISKFSTLHSRDSASTKPQRACLLAMHYAESARKPPTCCAVTVN